MLDGAGPGVGLQAWLEWLLSVVGATQRGYEQRLQSVILVIYAQPFCQRCQMRWNRI